MQEYLSKVKLQFSWFPFRSIYFLRTLLHTVCKKSAYSCVQLRTHPRTVAYSVRKCTQLLRDLGGKAPLKN